MHKKMVCHWSFVGVIGLLMCGHSRVSHTCPPPPPPPPVFVVVVKDSDVALFTSPPTQHPHQQLQKAGQRYLLAPRTYIWHAINIPEVDVSVSVDARDVDGFALLYGGETAHKARVFLSRWVNGDSALSTFKFSTEVVNFFLPME